MKVELRVQAPLGNPYRWLARLPYRDGAVSLGGRTPQQTAFDIRRIVELLEMRDR